MSEEVLRFDRRVANGVDDDVATQHAVGHDSAGGDAGGEAFVAVGEVEQRCAGDGFHDRCRYETSVDVGVHHVVVPSQVIDPYGSASGIDSGYFEGKGQHARRCDEHCK